MSPYIKGDVASQIIELLHTEQSNIKQQFYTFDYDSVILFEGYLDILYKTVTYNYEENQKLSKQMFVLGVDVWKTEIEAIDAFRKECEQQFEAAVIRYLKAFQKYEWI